MIEGSRQQVLRLMGEASTLRNQLAQIDEYLAAMERDSARARKEEESASGDLARLDQVKTELSAKLGIRQMELESLGEQRRRMEEELKERQSAHGGGKGQAGRGSRGRCRGRKRARIRSKKSFPIALIRLKASSDCLPQSSTARLSDFKPAGVLADFVEVTDPTWEKACETFLHDELEYVVVDGWNDAERGVELMRAESDGRATFLVHPEGGAPGAEVQITDPAIAGRLRDTLRLTNGLAAAPEGLLPRLAHCFLVSRSGSGAESGSAASRIAISCCPTASAITATRSAAAARPAEVRWL